MLLSGLLLLHGRYLGHEEPDETPLALGRAIPAWVLHWQRVERLHKEELGLHVQLQLGDALRNAGHGLHLPLC